MDLQVKDLCPANCFALADLLLLLLLLILYLGVSASRRLKKIFSLEKIQSLSRRVIWYFHLSQASLHRGDTKNMMLKIKFASYNVAHIINMSVSPTPTFNVFRRSLFVCFHSSAVSPEVIYSLWCKTFLTRHHICHQHHWNQLLCKIIFSWVKIPLCKGIFWWMEISI